MSWKDGLTPGQIRDAEIKKGAEVICDKYGAAQDIVAQLFDPDYKPTGKNAYNLAMEKANKGRKDMQ